MTPYQFERLEYLIGNKQLDLSELKMIDNLLGYNWGSAHGEETSIEWLLEWLRRKPYRQWGEHGRND